MKRFARLYQELDETTKTRHKLSSLVKYFREVDQNDAAWAIWFLCGNRPRRAVPVGKLREWCSQSSGIPEWLFAETYDFVGDLAETIALMLPPPQREVSGTLTVWINDRLLPLAVMPEQEKKASILSTWMELNQLQRFVFNKLLTGGFRVGVSQKLVVKALAEFSGIPGDVIAHRLMGHWDPTGTFFASLLSTKTNDADISRPYPFCLANSFVPDPTEEGTLFNGVALQLKQDLGNVSDWIIEWKWDGIRAQIVRRQGTTFIWSRGEELLTHRFPEVLQDAEQLPDGTVLDGELLGWKSGQVLPFADLQQRITRKSVGKKLLADVPVRFLAFDLLEFNGQDIRKSTLADRRQRLSELHDELFAGDSKRTGSCSAEWLLLSPILQPNSWTEALTMRQASREQRVEGLMLKRANSEYGVGRVAGLWWKWKVEPYHCDAVLIYAQRGHGKRAGKFTDYTFAAWENGQLVPFAKAYSGLTNDEIKDVDKFIRDNSLERFGPVQSVRAELVFELAFEGLQLSNRHKSGIAVRFPRIARWRKDKRPEEADTLERIRGLVRSQDVSRSQNTSEPLAKPDQKPLGGLFAGLDDETI